MLKKRNHKSRRKLVDKTMNPVSNRLNLNCPWISPFGSWLCIYIQLRTETWIGDLHVESIQMMDEIITCFPGDI